MINSHNSKLLVNNNVTYHSLLKIALFYIINTEKVNRHSTTHFVRQLYGTRDARI